MINGVTYDFEAIKINMPSGMVTMCKEISYDHEKEVKVISDKDNNPAGIVRGEFKGSVKIVMDRSNYEKYINTYAAGYGGIYNMPPLPVTVMYGSLGQTALTDKVEFKINKVGGLGGKKGDGLEITIEGPQTAIPVINGVPAFTPGM